MRDTNAYFVLGLAGVLTLGLLAPGIRKHRDRAAYLAAIACCIALFFV